MKLLPFGRKNKHKYEINTRPGSQSKPATLKYPKHPRVLFNSVMLAIASEYKFKCRFNLNWIVKLWIFIEVGQWSGGNQRITCPSCPPSIIWIPISELGHQALVTSVPRSEPPLSLLNESCILFGALTTRGDQYVFLNEDSNCVPFPVCTKFLFFETMQNYFPSTL